MLGPREKKQADLWVRGATNSRDPGSGATVQILLEFQKLTLPWGKGEPTYNGFRSGLQPQFMFTWNLRIWPRLEIRSLQMGLREGSWWGHSGLEWVPNPMTVFSLGIEKDTQTQKAVWRWTKAETQPRNVCATRSWKRQWRILPGSLNLLPEGSANTFISDF